MFQFIKIVLLTLLLFIISCDEKKSVNPVSVLGCSDSLACNYDANITEDNGSCEYPLECKDCNGDCLISNSCQEDCLGECGGDTIEDCLGQCGGSAADCGCGCANMCQDLDADNILDCLDDCISQGEHCLPDVFKWSLKMTATLGDYNDNIFSPSLDSVSSHFTIGTHHLSTDGLDILNEMDYSDIVQPPSTVENSIYFYTSYPEWEYEFGDNFIREYKLHNMSNIIWAGYVNSDFYGQKYIKITFELESDQNIISTLDFNLNGIENISSGDTSECESGYVVDNVDQEKLCSVTSSQFEYILPVVFQGPSYLIPFSIEIVDLVVY